jgi:hypothetical protein
MGSWSTQSEGDQKEKWGLFEVHEAAKGLGFLLLWVLLLRGRGDSGLWLLGSIPQKTDRLTGFAFFLRKYLFIGIADLENRRSPSLGCD